MNADVTPSLLCVVFHIKVKTLIKILANVPICFTIEGLNAYKIKKKVHVSGCTTDNLKSEYALTIDTQLPH